MILTCTHTNFTCYIKEIRIKKISSYRTLVDDYLNFSKMIEILFFCFFIYYVMCPIFIVTLYREQCNRLPVTVHVTVQIVYVKRETVFVVCIAASLSFLTTLFFLPFFLHKQVSPGQRNLLANQLNIEGIRVVAITRTPISQ